MRSLTCLVLVAIAMVGAALAADQAAIPNSVVNGRVGFSKREIWAEFNATAFLELGEDVGEHAFEEVWEFPEGDHPFKHLFFAYNPQGHPAFDGNGGGYGTPHVDFHFFTISAEERVAKATCTSFPPCPEDATSAAIYSYPPSSVVADDFFLDPTFGGHGVPGHGMHWLWKGDLPIMTPLGSGTEVPPGPPGWLPCLQQASGAPDAGCRLAEWYPGMSPVYISLDGKTAAHEAMFSKDFVRRLKSGMISNPYIIGYPQVRKRITDMEPPLYPFAIRSDYDAETDVIRVTLELEEYKKAACPEGCKECDENFNCIKCKRNKGLYNGECERCTNVESNVKMNQVNNVCIPLQNCARTEDGSFCKLDGDECAAFSDGSPRPCDEPQGCTFIDDKCTKCSLAYRSKCLECEEGYKARPGRCKPLN